MIGRIAATSFLVLAFAGVSAAGTAPTAFQLTFNGSHQTATFPTPLHLMHSGPFTSAAPFCASGNAVDTSHQLNPLAAIRRFTCDDGSGSIDARVELFPDEHSVGASEPWEIIGGTGQYATLRGKGTWKTLSVSGNENDPTTITFQTQWTGLVAFDATPPTVTVTKVTVKQRSKSSYAVQLHLTAKDDNQANAISYLVTLPGTSNTRLTVYTSKAPETPGPKTVFFAAHTTARTIRAAITVTDPLGNKRTLSRTITLHR